MEGKQVNAVFYHVTAPSQVCLEVWQLLSDAPVHFHTLQSQMQKSTKAPGVSVIFAINNNKSFISRSCSQPTFHTHTYIHTHVANPQLTPSPFSGDFAKEK